MTPDEVAGWLEGTGSRPSSVRFVAEGWDNLIFEADGLFVRAARRRLACEDIVKETRLLPLLGDLGLAVPRLEVVPAEIEALEWPWFAYAPVAGEELTRALAGGAELGATAAALGRFLRGLHAPELTERTRGWLRPDTIRRTDIPFRRARTLDRIAALEAAGEPIDGAALRRVLDAAEDIPVLPGVSLVHGDLHFRHVLLGADGHPTGVIDWGDAHFGHPAVDLHGYWAFFGVAERRAFADAYGPIDDVTLRAARVIAVFIGAVLVLSAEDFGLPVVREAGLESLRRLLE